MRRMQEHMVIQVLSSYIHEGEVIARLALSANSDNCPSDIRLGSAPTMPNTRRITWLQHCRSTRRAIKQLGKATVHRTSSLTIRAAHSPYPPVVSYKSFTCSHATPEAGTPRTGDRMRVRRHDWNSHRGKHTPTARMYRCSPESIRRRRSSCYSDHSESRTRTPCHSQSNAH